MDMPEWAQMLITAIVAILASSGFWGFIQFKDQNKTSKMQLLMGLAHDRIVTQGMSYVERGWISKDEYEDFVKYLYTPYSVFGGNGLAERVMNEVSSLPIYSKPPRDLGKETRKKLSGEIQPHDDEFNL